jgi:putative ABC transport system permease protein
VPAAFSAEKLRDHDNHYLSVIGRVKPGVSLAQARAELDGIAAREQQLYPLDDKGRGFHADPLAQTLLGDQHVALVMMLGAVGAVLLIACANIANLQLARGRTRHKEIALRAALGASPRRIARQLLVENLLLGATSGGAGVLLAFLGLKWLVANAPPGVPRLDEAGVNGAALAFAVCVALLSSVLIGLVPAWRATSTHLSDAIKQGAGTSTGVRDRLRSSLVIGELALAMVLLAGASLLVRSALAVSQVNPGFDTANLVVGRIGLPYRAYSQPEAARQAFERIVAAAGAMPGVASAAVVSRAPLTDGGSSNGLIAEGKAIDPSNAVEAQMRVVSADYLVAARVPLKAGRALTPHDTRQTVLVTLVNETLARRLWPGQNPIGKRFSCCESGPKGREDPVWHEVVGVVGDVHADGLERAAAPEFYLPIGQMPPEAWDWIGRTLDIVVRTEGRAVPYAALRAAVAAIAPGVPVYGLSTMQEKIAGTLERTRFDTFLFAMFAATALLLASVGVYGVLSYVVAQRTRDIGVRMALGATSSGILWNVLADGARLAAAGLAIGLVAALAGSRLLATLLYGVQPTDPVTFVGSVLVLGVVVMLASYLPARRATRVNPLVALRCE